MNHIFSRYSRMTIADERRLALDRSGAFTLIELILSMALISVAVIVFVQASGMFGDRLSRIRKRAAIESDLMRLALYLDDMQDIAEASSLCGPDAESRELVCTFHSNPGGSEKRVPIFSLATNGFVSAEWGITSEHGVTLRYLALVDVASRKSIVHYGIFPGVTFVR